MCTLSVSRQSKDCKEVARALLQTTKPGSLTYLFDFMGGGLGFRQSGHYPRKYGFRDGRLESVWLLGMIGLHVFFYNDADLSPLVFISVLDLS